MQNHRFEQIIIAHNLVLTARYWLKQRFNLWWHFNLKNIRYCIL